MMGDGDEVGVGVEGDRSRPWCSRWGAASKEEGKAELGGGSGGN